MNQSITKKITTITAFLMLMFSVKTFGQIQPDIPTDAPPIFEKTISDVVNGPYEKTIEFTQNEDEFTVFEIAGYGVNTYATLNKNINLKDTQPYVVYGNYPKTRYLILPTQCHKCIITFGAIAKTPKNKLIETTINTFKKDRNELRLIAEKLHQKASSTKEIDLRNDLINKEIEILKQIGENLESIGLKTKLLEENSTINTIPINLLEIQLVPDLNENHPDYLYHLISNEILLARTCLFRGDYEKAISYINKSIDRIDLENKNLKIQLLYKYLLSYLYVELSLAYIETKPDSPEAEKSTIAAIEYSTISESYVAQITAYNNLGYLERKKHNLDKALELHKKALEINNSREFISNYSKEAIQRNLMKTNYYLSIITAIKGRYYDSLKLINEAEKTAQRYEIFNWLAHIKAAKGRIFLELKMYDDSLPEYQESWKLYENLNDSEQLGVLSINLGRFYSETGNHELALEYINKSYELFAEPKDKKYRIKVKSALANAYLIQKKYFDANIIFDELLLLKGDVDDLYFEGRTLTSKAEALIALNNFDEAINTLKIAAEKQQETKDDLYFTKSSYLLALAASKKNNPKREEIFNYLKIAENNIEKIRSKLYDDSIRQQYFALQKAIYELEINLYMSDISSEENLTQAILSAERFRSRTLLESIETDNITTNNDINRFESNLENLNSLKHIIADLNQEEKKEIQELPDINIIKNLDNDTAVLYFFSGTEKSYSWMITNEHIYSSEIPKSSELALDATKYISVISSPPSGGLNKTLWINLFNETEKLSSILLKPYIDELQKYKNLVVSPDGPLHRIPFSALDSNLNDKKITYFVESHNISYTHSLRTFDALLELREDKTTDNNSLLLVANPQINIDQNNFSTLEASLPSAKQEAKTIKDIWSKHGTIKNLDEKLATKSNIKNAITENYKVIHFATHALANWDYPEQSLIALSNTEIIDKNNANLTLKEIKDLNINSELVVLSACDTAVGKHIEGEGPIGLSRAFIEAGSKRVVASLWPIDDSASAQIMKNFYENLLVKKLPPSTALSLAQKNVRKFNQWSHPYYWSGFNLFGNPYSWPKHSEKLRGNNENT